MFKKESNNGAARRFTAVDLERYHRGQMTGAERHALERAALEDPFLEEALEGYALLPAGQAEGDMATLRERLARRVQPRRRAAAWWAAAAAIVVLGGAFVVYRMGRRKEAEMAKVVRVADTVRTAPVAARTADTVLAAAEAKAAPNAVAETRVEPHRTRRRTHDAVTKDATDDSTMVALAAGSSLVAAPAKTAEDSIVVAMAAARGAKPFSGKFARPAVPETLVGRIPGLSVDSFGNVAFKDQNATRVRVDGKQFFRNYEPEMFKNRVTDNNHQPIAGATLKIGPTNNYVMTDQNGFFSFNGADSQRVVVTAVGYTTKTYYAYELNNLAAVQLSQATSMLNDVVVVGYGASKSKKAARGYHAVTDTTAAQPLEGWSSYNEYISNNLQLPDPVVENHIHGEVDLAFEVDGAGKPVNISVVKSLCASCDAEAVRLLQQGPGWSKGKKAKGRKARGKLKVKF